MRLKNFSLSYGSQIFKSFSDEARIRIIFLLYQNKELCISDLEKILGFTQTKTSRHVNYLKNAGLVSSRKSDQWIFYFLKEEVYDIVSQVFSYLNKDSNLIADQETYNILLSNRELAANKIRSRSWQQ
ncbi:MAG: metalloregulator ArsR/SmtB family transcription factor [Bacteroidetes bacterium]|nr:metalloregulator ArsR/SmtB family transcription factor [Bacteroidota bacterium]MDA1121525.1 metalloregulator ArsR/SmtB family transcription factor [Bacteroidota bacterium]